MDPQTLTAIRAHRLAFNLWGLHAHARPRVEKCGVVGAVACEPQLECYCLLLACSWPSPGLLLPCSWLAAGLLLACSCLAPGLLLACCCLAPGLLLACCCLAGARTHFEKWKSGRVLPKERNIKKLKLDRALSKERARSGRTWDVQRRAVLVMMP